LDGQVLFLPEQQPARPPRRVVLHGGEPSRDDSGGGRRRSWIGPWPTGFYPPLGQARAHDGSAAREAERLDFLEKLLSVPAAGRPALLQMREPRVDQATAVARTRVWAMIRVEILVDGFPVEVEVTSDAVHTVSS